MKLNNPAPLVAAGLLMSTMAGCSDTNLRYLEWVYDDEQNAIPAGPADAHPGMSGSSLLGSTCFDLLSEDNLAPLDAETGDYYQPVLDWMDRTREKLGIDLLQRLKQYDPDRIEALMADYEDAGTDPTIDEVTEHMRELLVERGVTIWWDSNDGGSNLQMSLGDRRSDIDFFIETQGENQGTPWMIADIRCQFNGMNDRGSLIVNKLAAGEWDDITWDGADDEFQDGAWVIRHLDSPIADFNFVPASHCHPQLVDPNNSTEGSYSFPEGTVCFDSDFAVDGFEEGDLDNGTLLGQTTDSRFEELESGTELLEAAISGGEIRGRKFFEGSWFEE